MKADKIFIRLYLIVLYVCLIMICFILGTCIFYWDEKGGFNMFNRIVMGIVSLIIGILLVKSIKDGERDLKNK